MLLRIVEEMRLGLRETDELARWGGEEFLLLLPQTAVVQPPVSPSDFAVGLQRRRSTWRHNGSPSPAVSGWRSIVTEDLDACLKRADEALYSAKAQGRNRVVTSPN